MTWVSDDYFSKAQAYWERARSRGRDSDEFLLYVCFTVEFVARGAVCYVSPALNAAGDVESLLFASGQTPRTPAKTVEFVELIRRLQRLLPMVTDSEIASIRVLMDARNGELHGDRAELSQLSADSVMPTVFAFMVKVAEFSKQSVEVLLGAADAGLARQTADAMANDRSRRVRDLIRVCKERFFSLPDVEQKKRRSASETKIVSAVLTSGHHVMYLKCPACAQSGQLLAVPVGRSAAFVRADELVQEVRVVPTQYSCKCCELEIRGLDELMAAGFSHEYCSMDAVDPVDHFGIDPLDYVDRDEIAREYLEGHYEYRDE
jgi:hypothetical protein